MNGISAKNLLENPKKYLDNLFYGPSKDSRISYFMANLENLTQEITQLRGDILTSAPVSQLRTRATSLQGDAQKTGQQIIGATLKSSSF